MAVTQVTYEVEGWGLGELVVADKRVVWHELPRPRPRRTSRDGKSARLTGSRKDPSRTPTRPGRGAGAVIAPNRSRGDGVFAEEVVRLLQAYFEGEPVPLGDVPVDLEYETRFLGACAAALRGVPRGEVVTYGELAALAGAPGAARAAGSFCARNRLGLFIPCHRVVTAGGLGSYGTHGTGYKRRLLALEGYVDGV